MIAMNARTLGGAMGGQQRVALEIGKRIAGLTHIVPETPLLGIKGHLWEQAVLPLQLGRQWLWSPSGTGPLLVRRQIVTMHDAAPFDVPDCFSPSFTRFYQTLLPLLAKRVAKIVTVSQFSKDRLMHHLNVDPQQIDIIANGVSDHFRPAGLEAVDIVRTKLNLPQRYVLVNATADRRKNFAAFLQAWRTALPELDPDLHLVAMGNLRRTHVFGAHDFDAAREERFRHVGFVEDVDLPALLSGSEIFAFPSLYEGFGIPILEAMACGAPVLTSNLGAMKEVASDAALLVDPSNVKDMALGLIQLTREASLREGLSRSGLARAAPFTWDAAAARYQALFTALMTGEMP